MIYRLLILEFSELQLTILSNIFFKKISLGLYSADHKLNKLDNKLK